MGKVLDFDLFMSERNKETIDVKVYGKTYQVAREVPALVPVMMARAEENADTTVSYQMILRAADGWFGKDVVDEFCAKGMTTNELANLVTRMFQMINGEEDDGSAEEYTDEDSRVAAKSNKAKK